MQYFNYNGKFYKEGTPIAEPGNRGLRYGDGLFETIKMVNGELILGKEHFNRLWHGLSLLQFKIPKLFTPQKLQQEMFALAKKNKHQKFARIRLSVVRGNGGLYDAENHNPNYIVQTWALPDGKGTLNQNGLVLNIYKEALKSCDAFSNLKHNNFLPYTMAALFAKKNNCNDALVLNGYNRICDSSIANVFIVKDEIIYTPPLSEGCIAGVTAAYVIAKLQNSLYKVIEKPLQINDVLNADEVFLTNSIQNIQWVKQIGNSVYKNEMIQKICAACKLV